MRAASVSADPRNVVCALLATPQPAMIAAIATTEQNRPAPGIFSAAAGDHSHAEDAIEAVQTIGIYATDALSLAMAASTSAPARAATLPAGRCSGEAATGRCRGWLTDRRPPQLHSAASGVYTGRGSECASSAAAMLGTSSSVPVATAITRS